MRQALFALLAAAVVLSAAGARADAAADAARAEAMLAERGAKFDAQREIHRRTEERVRDAILAATYTGKYLKRLGGEGLLDFARGGYRRLEPFKSVYDEMYEDFWAEEAARYAAEQ